MPVAVDIRAVLEDIDRVVDRKRLGVELNPGAAPEEIARLSELAEATTGHRLPDSVVDLYRWHDGQKRGATLIPGENRRLLSLDEAVDSWLFFLSPQNELQLPYRREWLPIATNDGGDYLVFDLSTGSLVGYWHDDPRRDVEHRSLLDFARHLQAGLSQAAAPRSAGQLLESGDPATLA